MRDAVSLFPVSMFAVSKGAESSASHCIWLPNTSTTQAYFISKTDGENTFVSNSSMLVRVRYMRMLVSQLTRFKPLQ